MMNTNSQGYRGTGSFGSGEPLRKKNLRPPGIVWNRRQ